MSLFSLISVPNLTIHCHISLVVESLWKKLFAIHFWYNVHPGKRLTAYFCPRGGFFIGYLSDVRDHNYPQWFKLAPSNFPHFLLQGVWHVVLIVSPQCFSSCILVRGHIGVGSPLLVKPNPRLITSSFMAHMCHHEGYWDLELGPSTKPRIMGPCSPWSTLLE